MNEGTGMTDGAGASEAAGMDAQGAAAIMQQAQERARHELTINRPVIFVSWALVYLLGYGVVWLSVRGQRPFHAPEGWALALLALLAVLALGVTAGVTDRAASGVGGVSQLRRRIYWLSLAVGCWACTSCSPRCAMPAPTTRRPGSIRRPAQTAQEAMDPIIMEAVGAGPIRETGERAPPGPGLLHLPGSLLAVERATGQPVRRLTACLRASATTTCGTVSRVF